MLKSPCPVDFLGLGGSFPTPPDCGVLVLSPWEGGGRAGVPLRHECRHRVVVEGFVEAGCGEELGSLAMGGVRTGPAGMVMGL